MPELNDSLSLFVFLFDLTCNEAASSGKVHRVYCCTKLLEEIVLTLFWPIVRRDRTSRFTPYNKHQVAIQKTRSNWHSGSST